MTILSIIKLFIKFDKKKYSDEGNYKVSIIMNAIFHHNGKGRRNLPFIYESCCCIDVEFFLFDKQEFMMKFGSWTYDGKLEFKITWIFNHSILKLDLRHMNQLPTNNSIGIAMDLRDFYISTEWDVMEVPAVRNEKYYTCCEVSPATCNHMRCKGSSSN